MLNGGGSGLSRISMRRWPSTIVMKWPSSIQTSLSRVPRRSSSRHVLGYSFKKMCGPI